MNRLALLFLVNLPAANDFAQADTPDFVQTHGQLAVRGTQLVDAKGEPIVL